MKNKYFRTAKKTSRANIFSLVGIVSFVPLGTLGWSSTCLATEESPPPRISAYEIDVTKVKKIYISPGMGVEMKLKQNVTEVWPGNDDDVKAKISGVNSKNIQIKLSRAAAEPTNFFVDIGDQTYVFDVIPALLKNQDIVKIVGSFGSPEIEGEPRVLIFSSGFQESSARVENRNSLTRSSPKRQVKAPRKNMGQTRALVQHEGDS